MKEKMRRCFETLATAYLLGAASLFCGGIVYDIWDRITRPVFSYTVKSIEKIVFVEGRNGTYEEATRTFTESLEDFARAEGLESSADILHYKQLAHRLNPNTVKREKSRDAPLADTYFEDIGEYDYSIERGIQLNLPDMNRDGLVGTRETVSNMPPLEVGKLGGE